MEHLPHKIFIVRHSEREDHMRPEWHLDADRPHDPPITANGVALCQKLGLYLAGSRGVAPGSVVVLSSPLLRCVQTSHAIAEGLVAGGGGTGLDAIPIHLEPGLIEGAYWLQHDLDKARTLRQQNSKASARSQSGPADSSLQPTPVYMPTEWLQRNISLLVRGDGFGLCATPKYRYDQQKVLREEEDVKERCVRAAQALAACKRLAGKTVICVGHGETTVRWFNALCATPSDVKSPLYTAFAELAPAVGGAGTPVQWLPVIAPFKQHHVESLQSV